VQYLGASETRQEVFTVTTTDNVTHDIAITITGANDAPVALGDIFAVDEDQTVTGNVLDDNENGPDSDPEGDALTVSLVLGPAEGILTLNGDGSFRYEADADVFDLAEPDQVIEQSFTYQIDDGNGALDQATAAISVTILDDGETISSKNGKDDVVGTDGGEDILYGGNGKDRLFGLDGADQMFGGNGKDFLDGGEGPDKLHGGNGNDTLIGGIGDDELTGGRGSDSFVFALGSGTDTVMDFDVGEDQIGLYGLGFDDLTIGQTDDGATISANSELLAVLIGVDADSINEGDTFGFI
jgi:VCBS repeat-containing protein